MVAKSRLSGLFIVIEDHNVGVANATLLQYLHTWDNVCASVDSLRCTRESDGKPDGGLGSLAE